MHVNMDVLTDNAKCKITDASNIFPVCFITYLCNTYMII